MKKMYDITCSSTGRAQRGTAAVNPLTAWLCPAGEGYAFENKYGGKM